MNILKTLWMTIFRQQADDDGQIEQSSEVSGSQRGQLMQIDEEERSRQSAPEEPSLEEKLRLNAGMIIENLSQHAGFTLGFNEESVAYIDGFIERQRAREGFDPGGLVNTLGSFLGECMCRKLGGEWKHQSNGQLAVQFSDGNAAFPFNKVQKQFANGEEDSILSFYQSAAVLFSLRKSGTSD